jgi:myo-inositol catabolism protein IolC
VWNTGLADKKVALKLSHHNVVMDEVEIRSSANKERIHKISAVTSAKALYSAFVEDLTTVRCFPDFYEIGVKPRYTRYQPVDFRSSILPAQSASVKP